MIDRTLIRSYMPPWGDRIQILISKHEDNVIYIAKEIVWEKAIDGQLFDPTLYLFREDAQELMDRLWSCGLRPTEGSGSAGALQATQNHLKDMQKLAFFLLENR